MKITKFLTFAYNPSRIDEHYLIISPELLWAPWGKKERINEKKISNPHQISCENLARNQGSSNPIL